MAAYVFFTSYARLDNQGGALEKAVEILRQRVTAKIGEPAVIFFDTTEMKNGVEWEQKLGSALQVTRVIVCLCSPSYMKSAFCAKEFEIFRRRVDAAGHSTVAIIPLIWEPAALPAVIRRFHQPKDPRFAGDYYTAGLFKLSILPSQQEKFLSAIEAVADDVNNADKESKLPSYGQPVVYDALPSFFQNPKPGRYGLRLTVLNQKQSQWKPGTVRNNVGALVDTVAESLRAPWEDAPPDAANLAAQLKDSSDSRLVWLFVVDRNDLDQPPWQQMLAAIGQSVQDNVAVLVGWNSTQNAAPADINNELRQRLPAVVNATYFLLDDEEGFKEAVKKSFATVRMALIGQDSAAKVEAPDIRAEALTNGIPVDSLSTLPSPGAMA